MDVITTIWFSEGLVQGFHFVRINVALTDFNFSEGASRQVAAEHLELGGELFLCQVIVFSDFRKMCAKTL